MNNPFEYVPEEACNDAFRKLCGMLETLRKSGRPEDEGFCRELDEGKMLGVLIASDSSGGRHTLYAFSGQAGNAGFHHDGFVAPVFDYLRPDGYFKTREREISRQNSEIAVFEKGVMAAAKSRYEREKSVADAEIAAFREKCRQSKLDRDSRRAAGVADDAEMAAMIRRSQFEKAELHRLKKGMAAKLEPYAGAMTEAELRLAAMKEKRRIDSENLQKWLFSHFMLLNARGESRSVGDIFAETPLKTPPSGAGECCAPKLLQAAYLRGLRPELIAEYWYGKGKEGEVRIHGAHYPACRGKCLPVLRWMLQGLDINPPLDGGRGSVGFHEPEIIYENRWFCVVDKPAGMLTVPGKRAAVSVQYWLSEKYGLGRQVRMAHRLDQDTSGLVIATFGDSPLKVMHALFATRKVEKTYVAVLEGDYLEHDIAPCGRIELPLSADWLDRPRQRVDFAGGKPATTEYDFTGVSAKGSRVQFRPLTGRTHQLRVHAASEHGLGMPIAGDRLYGRNRGAGSDRLLLHAHKIEFTFPIDGEKYSFESPVPF